MNDQERDRFDALMDARRQALDLRAELKAAQAWIDDLQDQRDAFHQQLADLERAHHCAMIALRVCVDRLVHGPMPANENWYVPAQAVLQDGDCRPLTTRVPKQPASLTDDVSSEIEPGEVPENGPKRTSD